MLERAVDLNPQLYTPALCVRHEYFAVSLKSLQMWLGKRNRNKNVEIERMRAIKENDKNWRRRRRIQESTKHHYIFGSHFFMQSTDFFLLHLLCHFCIFKCEALLSSKTFQFSCILNFQRVNMATRYMIDTHFLSFYLSVFRFSFVHVRFAFSGRIWFTALVFKSTLLFSIYFFLLW